MSKLESSDDDDWFNKDESELLKDLKIKVEEAKQKLTNENHEERIELAISYDEKYMQQWRSKAAMEMPQKLPKIPTSDLRKLAEAGNALDAFLFALTIESPEFFKGQICPNDAMDRVHLYIRLYAMIAELKVPGFHEQIIKHFTQDEQLLEQICMITTKIFTKRYKTLWKADCDKIRLDTFISDLQLLFLQAEALDALTPKVYSSIHHIKHLLKTSDSKEVMNREAVLKLAQNLDGISTEEASVALAAAQPLSEIYPTLNELLQDCKNSSSAETQCITSLASHVNKSVNEYLKMQKMALRNDFVHSLADCVRDLKTNKELNSTLAGQVLLYENVEIILNEKFINARRHEMLFVDVLPDQQETRHLPKSVKLQLKTLKRGSLLCFTTSFDFDDLILALVTHQDFEFSQNGYIAIEIVRQFNIGNIYNKNLIMFSSPAFFEPYHNVYNYLSTCSIEDFPMKDVIVFGNHEIHRPNYITDKTIFNSEEYKFKPLTESPPVAAFPLNTSQREALQKVLRQNFALIQGPPGTGKTHLMVQLVKLLLENETPKPIVVVAYTNESLDKFLLKISNFTTSIVRLGGQTRLPEISRYNIVGPVTSDHVHPRLKRLYYVVDIEFKTAFEQLQIAQQEFDGTDESFEQVIKAQHKVHVYAEQLKTIRQLFNYYVARERSIVALTTTCAAKMNFLFRLLGCKIVIFEEAAEILESHVLACLTPQTEHVIMIGDHMQLKPFTSSYQHSLTCDLNISLFERLINRGTISPSVLLTQYRMRPVIAELMCPIFYEILYNDDSVEKYPLVQGMLENLYFLEHTEKEEQTKEPLTGASTNPAKFLAPVFFSKNQKFVFHYLGGQLSAAIAAPILWKYLRSI